MRALETLDLGARVLVIRIRSMGDCVLTTPAIRILHEYRPDLKIDVVVESRFHAIFEGNPAVSEVIPPEVLPVVRSRAALCLNLHGGTRSQVLAAASRARVRAGFAHHKGACLYNVAIPRAQEILGEERPVHTAEHLASAMFYLGCAPRPIPRAQLFAERNASRPPYAVIHAASAADYKTWPAANFVDVARHLSITPVFIGAAADDMSPFKEFECRQGESLEAIKSLISSASLFVGNDSGPAHIAAAFDVPLVVLFGRPEHQITWAPWQVTRTNTLVDPRGIAAISVNDVIASVDAVTGKPR